MKTAGSLDANVLMRLIIGDVPEQCRHVDGQLLVWTDWAGLTVGRIPKFVKRYADLSAVLTDATQAYIADVAAGEYPKVEHEYTD